MQKYLLTFAVDKPQKRTAMKKNYFWMMSFMLMASLGFTSCEFNPDEGIGYEISGHWFGDLDMYFGNEKAIGSEIEFIPVGWGYSRGRGIEIDYYRYGSERHYFDWSIRNGVIYMVFDDPQLDCAIVDYRLSYNYFSGCIANYYTLQNMTPFNLRSYDRYWKDYGYGYGGGCYWVKGKKQVNDSIAADSIDCEMVTVEPLSNDSIYSIRGVNRNK